MNIDLLRNKVEDVLTTLSVALSEANEIESKREALKASEYVNTEREKRLNDLNQALVKKSEDLLAQKQYIEEQNKHSQMILNKIKEEKEALSTIASEKRELEKEKLQFEIDKKGFESIKLEKEQFEADRTAFIAERAFFAKEKLAMSEAQKLTEQRLANIKQREDSLNRREQLIKV